MMDEVFGDELLVVTACFGGNVHSSSRRGSPKSIKDLEAFDNPMIKPRAISNTHRENQRRLLASIVMKSRSTCLTATEKNRRIPKLKNSTVPQIDSPPLSLHIYLGTAASHCAKSTALSVNSSPQSSEHLESEHSKAYISPPRILSASILHSIHFFQL